MVPTDAGEKLPAALIELLELDAEAEQKLLNEVLSRGWDQGCLLPLSVDREPPSVSPREIEEFMGRIAEREACYPVVADPYETEPPACADPGELRDGYVVLAQRCDLIKGLKAEPFVAVGRAARSSDAVLISSARAGTSATHLHLVDAADDEAWLLDLRAQWPVPKTWLADVEPIHLIDPGVPRRRFARGLGNRSARVPVPTAVVDGLQRPLRDWLYQSAVRRRLCEPFSDLLLLPATGDAWALIGLYGIDVKADFATKCFDDLFEAIRGKVPDFPLSEDDSDALCIDEVTVFDFLSAHRLDLDKVSFGSKSASSQAEPHY